MGACVHVCLREEREREKKEREREREREREGELVTNYDAASMVNL